MRNWMGKFIHNCIAHPAMCFLPKEMGERFHDWTIEKFWPPEYRVKWDHETDGITVDGQLMSKEE